MWNKSMKEKKVKFLLGQGCIIIETTEDTTVLRDKHGNTVKVDQFGKVLWYPVDKPH
jgi:hypothetical protein